MAVDAGQQAFVGAVGVGDVEGEDCPSSRGQVGEAVPSGTSWGRPRRPGTRQMLFRSTRQVQDPEVEGLARRPPRRRSGCRRDATCAESISVKALCSASGDPSRRGSSRHAVVVPTKYRIFVPSGEKIGDQLTVSGLPIRIGGLEPSAAAMKIWSLPVPTNFE